jgi:hypothetical protein
MKRLDIDRPAGLMSLDELHEQDRLCEALLSYCPRRTIAEALLTHLRDIRASLYLREGHRREPKDLTDEELAECIELVFTLTLFRPRRLVAVPLVDYLHALNHEREERDGPAENGEPV